MILCLCRGVVDGVVNAVIAEGASSLEQISAACAAGSDCGACHESLLELLDRRPCPLEAPRAVTSNGSLVLTNT